MTNAATTGLTAPTEDLRVISVQTGIVLGEQGVREDFAVEGSGTSVVERFTSGEDRIVVPAGTDLSTVRVTPDWHDDAWGLRVDYGAEGGDGVFLRWAWNFNPATDLAVGTAPADPATQLPPANGGNAPAPGDAEAGTGADTLVLNVSGDSYQGDAQFTVFVNGQKVGDVFTAAADHGTGSDAVTLHGDWGADAKVTVTFINDLWEGSAATDRNLHIDGATYNGQQVAGAAQTVWGNYGVEFATGGNAGTPPASGGTDAPAAPSTGGGAAPSDGGAPSGYTLVLADDFSNGYSSQNWGNPFNGGTYWNGAFTWSSADVGVRNGEMQVTMTDHGGWWTAGGFNSFKAGNTIQYGKIEFDAKVPDHQGTMTAILTWPATDKWPQDGEIDILETPHNENMFSTHYAGSNGDHLYDSIRSSTFDASQWNHYEMTWLPDRLAIAVNGQQVAEWTDPAEIPDVPHGFGAMGFVGSAADQWMGGAPDGSTPDQVTVSIDNVRMYQLDGIF